MQNRFAQPGMEQVIEPARRALFHGHRPVDAGEAPIRPGRQPAQAPRVPRRIRVHSLDLAKFLSRSKKFHPKCDLLPQNEILSEFRYEEKEGLPGDSIRRNSFRIPLRRRGGCRA
jgi:hypothetical protein